MNIMFNTEEDSEVRDFRVVFSRGFKHVNRKL